MNVEQVVAKIISDANEKANEIAAKADAEMSKQTQQLAQQLDEYNQQTQTLAKDAADDKTQRILAAARMAGIKADLQAKRQVIDKVFNEALNRLASLDDNAYCGLMEKLLTKAVQTGDEEVIVGQNETRLNSEFIKQLNRKLGNGYKGNLRLSDKKHNAKGGFILKRGDIRTNATLEVLVEQARVELETKTAGILFGN